MNKRTDRRQVVIDRMADHLLSEGLAGATLRPLAAAAGTSDRMLLYYFADKDELLSALLDRISERLLHELDRAISIDPKRPFAVLLDQVWAILSSERHKPFMNIWLELAAAGARGLQPHRKVSGAIVDGYLAWVAERLEPQAEGGAPSSAPHFLAAIQGMYLLNGIGRSNIANAAMTELLEGSNRT